MKRKTFACVTKRPITQFELEVGMLQLMLQHQDALHNGVKHRDTLALAVRRAYAAWYESPEDKRYFRALSSAMDKFILAQRQTVLV